jgi:hypothetical protein
MAFQSNSAASVAIKLPYTTFGEAATFSKTVSGSAELLPGTGENQGDEAWLDIDRVLTATSEELDLAGGLTDLNGNAITFTKIKELLIVNKNTTSGELLKVGGAAANAFLLFDDATDIESIDPGGFLHISSPVDGKTVTAGTGDKLKIDAGANTITFNIILTGVSA